VHSGSWYGKNGAISNRVAERNGNADANPKKGNHRHTGEIWGEEDRKPINRAPPARAERGGERWWTAWRNASSWEREANNPRGDSFG